jgi:hypothetical protein
MKYGIIGGLEACATALTGIFREIPDLLVTIIRQWEMA